MTITYRSQLNRPMTWAELDANFSEVQSQTTLAQQAATSAAQSADSVEGVLNTASGYSQSAANSAAEATQALAEINDMDIVNSVNGVSPDENGNVSIDAVSMEDVNEVVEPLQSSISALEGDVSQLNAFQDGIEKITPTRSLDDIVAKMWRGQTVKFACYGDSTTDGNNTTGFTANLVDANGNAVGGNHNLTAPNSWPVKLQTLLRDMFSNANINVYNAGYGGKKISDGWALSNYEAAITANSSYGLCDVVFVDFSLNDGPVTESLMADFLSNYQLLIEKIISENSLPVLLTSGPMYRKSNAPTPDVTRDSSQIDMNFNNVKRYLAARYKIPLMDKAQGIKDWLERSKKTKWYTIQNDALHFNDTGHAFQASWIGSQLYTNTIQIGRGQSQDVNYMDSRANSPIGVNEQLTTIPQSRFGANAILTTSQVTPFLGKTLMTQWVWASTPDVSCIYRGFDNDGVFNLNANSLAVINVTSVHLNTTVSDSPRGSGFLSAASPAPRYNDQPFTLSRLEYGLSKVTYVAPAVAPTGSLFFGYFSYTDNWKSGYFDRTKYRIQNLLESSGPVVLNRTGTGITVFSPPAMPDGSNVWTWGSVNKSTELNFTANISANAGLVLMCGPGYTGDATPVGYEAAGIILYKMPTTNLLRLYWFTRDTSGVSQFSASLAESTTAVTVNQDYRISFTNNGTTASVNIYLGFNSTTSVLTYSEAVGSSSVLPKAGVFGGGFFNLGSTTSTSFLNISNASVIYS